MEPISIITAALPIIGTVLTVIIGPLLAWWIKRYWEKKVIDAEQKRKDELAEVVNRQENKETATDSKDVNDSIDQQRRAKEEWLKGAH